MDTTPIQLTTWNVQKGLQFGWEKQLKKALDASSLCLLQEMPYHSRHLELFQQQEFHFAPGAKAPRVQTGVLTAAHTNALKQRTLKHPEPWIRYPKATLITEYPLSQSGLTLWVANIHGINFTIGTRAFAQQLHDIAAALKSHSGPMIIAGDFNSWNPKRNKAITQALFHLGLHEVSFDPHHLKKVFGHPLDRVFYRGLSLQHHTVIPVTCSDHNMLQAQFLVST